MKLFFLHNTSGKASCLLLHHAVLCLWLFTGCGPISEGPQYWQIAASGNINLYPVVHGNKAILPGKCDDADCLKAVRLDTGEPLWEWLDRDTMLRKCYYNLKHYIFDDILLLPAGSNLIAISLDNGKTLWRDQRNWQAESFLEGLGASAFRTYYDKKNRLARVLAFNVHTGDSRQIKVFPMPDTGNLFVRTPAVAAVNGKDTICISSIIHHIPKQITSNQLVFWRLNDGSFQKTITIYPDNLYGDGVTQQGTVNGMKSYWLAGQHLVCISLDNQEELWRDTFPHGMLTSRLFLNDGQLFYACEDETLYALNAENGDMLWQCSIAGTPSRLYVNKGKIYLIGGSDGFLYVIDKNNGTLLFKYQPAGLGLEKGSSFRRAFYAGNDKLIVTDFRNWHAFDIQEEGEVYSPFIK